MPGHQFLPKHEYLAPLEAILDLGPEFLTPPEANLVFSGWVGLPLRRPRRAALYDGPTSLMGSLIHRFVRQATTT